jgi:Predicted permease
VSGMILLAILHVPYVLLLGVLLGLFSVIPLIGPYLGMLPALAVALLVSPWTALVAGLLLYLLIHVVGTFIAPVIFRRSLNLSPLLMILSLAAGYRLGGLAGMILAVPMAAVIQVLVVNLYLEPKLRREGRAPLE